MDKCINWLGAKDKNGYGQTTYQGKQWKAHRLSYFLEKGSIGPNNLICHKCDNPSCINPKHLFEGTPLDNMRDMISKGRANHYLSENNGRAKLNWDIVSEIRNSTESLRSLAKKFNISKSSVGFIKQNKTWKKNDLDI